MKHALPTQEGVLAAMDTAKESIDAAQYLETQINRQLDAARAGPEAEPLRKMVSEFRQAVTYQLSTNPGTWSGKQVEASPVQNMHARIADDMAVLLKNKQEQQQDKEVRLDYAISPQGQFVRGYEALEPQSLAQESRGYDVKA